MTQTQAVLVLAGVLLLALAAMYRGWRRRARRQADLPPLPERPDPAAWSSPATEGVYVGTTAAGAWLDRIVVHGLGARSRAWLSLADEGVLVEREGAPALFIPTGAIRNVRRDRALAGTVVEAGGLLVISWEHGGRLLDTGFRQRHADDDLYPQLAGAVGGRR